MIKKERPILFSAPMVRAILSGAKTQTRRILKPCRYVPDLSFVSSFVPGPYDDVFTGFNAQGAPIGGITCSYEIGSHLWVRETWGVWHPQYISDPAEPTFYKADYPSPDVIAPPKWRPSIHMPRARSRITLEITSVRVERLQDMSEADAIAEGIESFTYGGLTTWRNYLLTDEWAAVSPMFENPIDSFRSLWESINGKGSWMKNPWVWVIEFKMLWVT